MKKLVTILVVLMSLGLSLGGCKKKDEGPKLPDTTALQEKAEEAAEAAVEAVEEAAEEAVEE